MTQYTVTYTFLYLHKKKNRKKISSFKPDFATQFFKCLHWLTDYDFHWLINTWEISSMTHWIIGLWSNHTFEVGSLLSQQPTQILPSDILNCHLSIWKIYTARWLQGKELNFSPMYCNYTETKIFIVKTSIFTINAINLKITCGHPANKAKNLTMTYLYPIQNCF